ncbi:MULTISPECIES: aldo/keto reductase [unclassified Polaromonas]|uniref:aldo/keto reductase n=1 Tax=unclassified Polaromonas TaxID=2638319 RepID=UPI0018C97383|nr:MULTISPECIES: aldo/keto reductase [unclassified Polaromonas]MBG6071438.1 D-threo-aldose 1-dehydrogenase [Polaromonas sp. CG_9.7]MBG6113439.1 D-threo-aldose 1-dehydrogenase [Polaromonas sp. CG_9.2]MDH6183104.1 D-threo-aldose 1-dehydrogenase [Polaromonas sp. CG_23.6]
MTFFFPPCAGSGLRLGLGGAPLGNLFEAVGDDAARQLVEAAWQSGCRSFDTAPHYGHGLSEHRLGAALRGQPRGDFVLSSKVGRLLAPDADAPRAQHGYVDILPFRQSWDYSAAGTRRSVEDSLQRLGLARLDVAYVHDPDAATHGANAPSVLRQVLDDTLPALRQLQAEGLVGAIGLGTNDVEVVLQVLAEGDLDVLMLAGRYSLLDPSALPELLPQCTARGVRVALGGVFNSGILATGTRAVAPTFNYAPAAREWLERTAQIESVCENFGVPLRAAALQFPLAHPAVDIVMLGARTVAQWEDAHAMLRHAVAPEFWTALRAQGLISAEAPTP